MSVVRQLLTRGKAVGALVTLLAALNLIQITGAAAPAAGPCTPPPNAVIAVTADHTGMTVTGAPEGTVRIKVAYMPSMTSPGYEVHYTSEPYPAPVYTPPAGNPVVDAQAMSAAGASIGEWAGRIQTTPASKPPGKLKTGLVLNADTESATTLTAVNLGAKIIRAEFSIDESPAALERLIARVGPNVTVQPLIGFNGRLPSPGEAQGIGKFAVKGVSKVELGNETNYQVANTFANGKLYGERTAEATRALPAGVGLLAQGSDAGSGSPEWLNGVFAGLGGARPAGWTIHPYFGGNTASAADGWGKPMLERMVAGLAAHGDTSTPIDATEYGPPSTPNGTVMTSGQRLNYSEAAELLRGQPAVLEGAAKGRLEELLLYCGHDLAPVGGTNRENYFGALTINGAAKEPFTAAVRVFFAA